MKKKASTTYFQLTYESGTGQRQTYLNGTSFDTKKEALAEFSRQPDNRPRYNWELKIINVIIEKLNQK